LDTGGGVVSTGGGVTGGVATGVVVETLPVVSVVVPVTGGVVTAGGVVTTGVVTTGAGGTTLESKSSDLDTGVGMTTGAGAAKVARHFISLLTSTGRGFWILFPQSPVHPLKVMPWLGVACKETLVPSLTEV
jgi:hypothetical protein